MAKKDVEEYFNKICDDYHEMLETLREIEELVKTEMIDPDRLDNIQKMIAPLMQNYERWSYMMFLLNKPVNKKKHDWYDKTTGKKLKDNIKEDMIEQMFKEDKEVIDALKEEFNN